MDSSCRNIRWKFGLLWNSFYIKRNSIKSILFFDMIFLKEYVEISNSEKLINKCGESNLNIV